MPIFIYKGHIENILLFARYMFLEQLERLNFSKKWREVKRICDRLASYTNILLKTYFDALILCYKITYVYFLSTQFNNI